jgi:hypothetical protein
MATVELEITDPIAAAYGEIHRYVGDELSDLEIGRRHN